MADLKGDQNDLYRAGGLPADPLADAKIVSEDVPRVRTVGALLSGALERALKPWDRKQVSTTGHYEIDRITGGPRRGFCWLLGAATSWGKSSFAVMLADDNLRQGKTVLIVSSEDSEDVYGDRLMARRSRVSADDLRRKRFTLDDHQRMTEVVSEAESKPVFIDARGKTVEWLAPRVTQCIKEYAIDIVIFDYIGTFVNQAKQQDRRTSLAYIGRVLTDIVKQSAIAGVILSQLTEDASGDKPTRNNIRDCRDLAHAAEVVLIGWVTPEDIELQDGRVVLAGRRVMVVDKNKTGPRGALIELPWDERSACFNTVLDPELEASAAAHALVDWNDV